MKGETCVILALLTFTAQCLDHVSFPVADPGFPVGGACTHWGGMDLQTWVLFGENVCENERIGSQGVACARHAPPPRSANAFLFYRNRELDQRRLLRSPALNVIYFLLSTRNESNQV